ncbi:MAG: hypothetical protein HQK67_00015 [Desulfamplus sp.]|nr:hypothetical protein [Desulfamplus sp.]
MNPFKVLNVNRDVSQKDIISAVALAMRAKKYSASEIAIAQKTLLDPVSRAAESFLEYIDIGDYKEHLLREIIQECGTADVTQKGGTTGVTQQGGTAGVTQQGGTAGVTHGDGIDRLVDVENLQYLELFHT